jgi:hypothetical protein
MLVTAKARSDKGWTELNRSVPIPVDLLDPTELAAANDEEMCEETHLS